MKWSKKCLVLVLAAAGIAVALRLPSLQQRPMHTDEAVHAYKFGELLEENHYRYNPDEYHGPTLNYFTLIPAWLASAEKITDITEFTLRIVPVFFGVLLILLLLLAVDGLGPPVVFIAALLTAISPAFVFYSRYYIQEMLLVCFTFGLIVCGWRYTRNKNIAWALLAGVFIGLMHATKETCIIAFASMLLALLFTSMIRKRRQGTTLNIIKAIKPRHILAAAAAAVTVSALFYSSFLTNPGAITDAIRTYAAYFNRASQNQLHNHPWYYYLEILTCSGYTQGPVFSEALILLLAAVGLVVVITGKPIVSANFHLLTFIALYTIIMTVFYSVIPYKTPWCLLGFLHGMILLAAIGAVAVIKLSPNLPAKVIISLLLAAGALNLTWQASLGSYKYYADTRNPYVYAHTGTDIFTIVQRTEDIADTNPNGRNIPVQVICLEGDYWPLPWYLRSFSKVYWWSEIDETIMPAPIIIASPSVEPALRKFFDLPPPGEKNLYVPLFDSYMELRPQVEIRGYATKKLWDSYQQHQPQPELLQIPTDR